MYGHQTASCPHCGKDSWKSIWEATFEPQTCMWCKGLFMYKPGKGSVKVNSKKDKK